MEDLRGANALLTGAAGGLGRYIARALGGEGVRLVVSGRRREPLEGLCNDLRAGGGWAEPILTDLTKPCEAEALVERAEAAVGPLDVLVSNAGIEVAAAFPAFSDDELRSITQVNLISPMVLARHALPGMLARGRGHLVVVSSLAGRLGNAYNVLYATTKAGLVGFARSLHAELAGTPVGASVICPGFVAQDGMYADVQREFDLNAPLALRPVTPDSVAASVVEAIRKDPAEVLVTGWPMRPLLALQELAPGLAERIVTTTGASRFFLRLAELTGRSTPEEPPPEPEARQR